MPGNSPSATAYDGHGSLSCSSGPWNPLGTTAYDWGEILVPGRLNAQLLVQDKESAAPLVDCTVLLFNREATPLPVEVTAV